METSVHFLPFLFPSFQVSLHESNCTNHYKLSDPYERPVENIEYDKRHRKYYPAAFVDPLSDLLRCHRCEIVQLGESRSAWKWLRRRGTAVDGRDAADRIRTRIRILILFYSHRRDVDRAWKTLEMIDITILSRKLFGILR